MYINGVKNYLRLAIKLSTSSRVGMTLRGTFACGDEGCGCVCEGEQFFEVFFGEVLKAVVEYVVQGACAEGIAGTGGLDGVFLKERSSLYDACPCSMRGFRPCPW